MPLWRPGPPGRAEGSHPILARSWTEQREDLTQDFTHLKLKPDIGVVRNVRHQTRSRLGECFLKDLDRWECHVKNNGVRGRTGGTIQAAIDRNLLSTDRPENLFSHGNVLVQVIVHVETGPRSLGV